MGNLTAHQAVKSDRGQPPGSILYRALTTTILFLITVILGACDYWKPILIGFSGQLTGPHANMGVHGRDGVLLAAERVNAAGGISGRKVKVIVRDDKGTPDGARQADQALIDAGVVAIIGHMTSSQTMAALPIVEKAGMVMLSPTTSTSALSGRVDHFFRVGSDSGIEARALARHAIQNAGLKRLAIISDSANAAYTQNYLDAFSDEIEKTGGVIVAVVKYSSTDNPAFGTLVSQLGISAPQGLLTITSAYDAAIIAQQTRILKIPVHLFGSGWAQSAPLIENGGKSVEKMSFVTGYDLNSQAPEFMDFMQQYQARFNQRANFMATAAYDAMMLLSSALEKTEGQAQGLLQALPGTRIQGLASILSLDRFGDCVRSNYLSVVENGKFVTKGKLRP